MGTIYPKQSEFNPLMRFHPLLVFTPLVLSACGPGPLTSEAPLKITPDTRIGDLQVYYKENPSVGTVGIEQAIIDNQLEEVQRYLRSHSSLILETVKGRTTLLHLAIRHNQYDIVSFLLSQENKHELLDSNGQAPIYSTQNITMLKHLLSQGVSPFSLTNSSLMAHSYFEELAYKNEWVLLDVIFQHPQTQAKAHAQKQKLLERFTQKATFKYLIDIGCDLSKPLTNGGSVLSHYPVYTDLEMIKWAIEAGANPNLKSTRAEPPLMLAGFLESFQYLVEHGAKFSVEGVSEQDLIQYHIKEKHVDIVNYLLDKHAQAFPLDALLAQSIQRLDYGWVKKLLQVGAKPDPAELSEADPFNLQYDYPGDTRVPAIVALLQAT